MRLRSKALPPLLIGFILFSMAVYVRGQEKNIIEEIRIPGAHVRATTWEKVLADPNKYSGIRKAFDGILYGNDGWYARGPLPAWIEITYNKPQQIQHVTIYHGSEDWVDNLALRDFSIQGYDDEQNTWMDLAPPMKGNSEALLESNFFFTPRKVTKIRLLITGAANTNDGGWVLVREIVADNLAPSQCQSGDALAQKNSSRFVVRRDKYAIFGLHDSGDFVSQPKVFDQVLDLYSNAGIKWFIYGCGSPEYMPGVWSFAHMDRWVRQVRSHGLQTYPQWVRTIWWDSSAPAAVTDQVARGAYAARDKKAFADQVQKLVEHYKDQIGIWEYRNELNFSIEWSSPIEEYVSDLEIFNGAAKHADPDCQVMSVGVCSGRATFRKLMNLGMSNYCDIIGYHPYHKRSVQATFDEIDAVRSIMAQHDCYKPIWNGEVGDYSTGQFGVDNENIKAQRLTALFSGLSKKIEVAGYWCGTGTVPTAWKDYHCTAGILFFNGKYLQIMPAYDSIARLIHADEVADLNVANLGETENHVSSELPLPIRMKAGQEKHSTFAFKNTGKRAQAYAIEVSGINPQWIKIENQSGIIEPDKLGRADIVFLVPSYVPPGEFEFSVRVHGAKPDRYWLGDTRLYKLAVDNNTVYCGLKLSDWDLTSGILFKPVGLKVPWNIPGGSMPLRFSVINKGSVKDSFKVLLEGVPSEWVKLPPPQDLEPGAKGKIEIEVNFPKDASPAEYIYNIKVHSVTKSDIFEHQEGYIILLPATDEQVQRSVQSYRRSLK